CREERAVRRWAIVLTNWSCFAVSAAWRSDSTDDMNSSPSSALHLSFSNEQQTSDVLLGDDGRELWASGSAWWRIICS
ncbi:UNVERIFIED_CONTAM: hypothetical protein NY603_23985, partial [Bacteroidetes bacterium 56_B9]